MKLIKREVVIDNETFRPQIIITIALDLQVAEDQMAVDPDEYFAQVGRDFVEMLETME